MQGILRYTTWCPLNSLIRNCYLSFFFYTQNTSILSTSIFFTIVEWDRNLLILFGDLHCSLGIEMSKLKSLLKKNGREHISLCHSRIFCYFLSCCWWFGFQFQQSVENGMDTVLGFSYVLLVRIAESLVFLRKGIEGRHIQHFVLMNFRFS